MELTRERVNDMAGVQRRLRDERRGAEANRDRIARRRGRAGGVGGDPDEGPRGDRGKETRSRGAAAESPDAPDPERLKGAQHPAAYGGPANTPRRTGGPQHPAAYLTATPRGGLKWYVFRVPNTPRRTEDPNSVPQNGGPQTL